MQATQFADIYLLFTGNQAWCSACLQVTHDISHLTCADVFRAPGVQTPVITRFSTVIHERGSPETLRDPRGFAVKFYTREGNWDMVGNNMPVFFIRDGIKFPDMIHALKPNPKNHIQEWWRITDFFSHVPESMHMVSCLSSCQALCPTQTKVLAFNTIGNIVVQHCWQQCWPHMLALTCDETVVHLYSLFTASSLQLLQIDTKVVAQRSGKATGFKCSSPHLLFACVCWDGHADLLSVAVRL